MGGEGGLVRFGNGQKGRRLGLGEEQLWGWGVEIGVMRGWGVDGEVGGKGRGLNEEEGRGEGLNDGLRLGEFGPIDQRPPRDGCGYKSSVRGMYGADGGL